MVPLTIELKDIKRSHLTILEHVRHFVEVLKGDDLTCHDVCAEIVSKRPDLHLIHYKGTFADMDHSWLVFADDEWVVIDPYPWACGSGPILVTLVGMSPWLNLYVGVPVNEEVCK